VVLAAILFVMFQAVFAWAQPLMELLNSGFDALGEFVHATLPPACCRASFRTA